MSALTMPHQQVDTLIVSNSIKECRGRKKHTEK
jgi:hypothetical protein